MQKTINFDESIFPYRFECLDCPHDSTTTVTFEQAVDAVPPGFSATARQAVDRALQSKGWWEIQGRKLCPECVEDLE